MEYIIIAVLIFAIMILGSIIFLAREGFVRSLKIFFFWRSGLAYIMAIYKGGYVKLDLKRKPTEYKFFPKKEDSDFAKLRRPMLNLEGLPLYVVVQGIAISIDPMEKSEPSEQSKTLNQAMIQSNLTGKIQGASGMLNQGKYDNYILILVIICMIAAVLAAFFGFQVYDMLQVAGVAPPPLFEPGG